MSLRKKRSKKGALALKSGLVGSEVADFAEKDGRRRFVTGFKGLCLPGSYTVEAAVVMPLFFITIAMILKQAFTLDAQVMQAASGAAAASDSARHVQVCLEWLRLTGVLKEIIH